MELTTKRPSFTDINFDIAEIVSRRATCERRHIGCVIVDDRNRIIATGYNGSPSGLPHCTDVGCGMVDGHCKRTVHAEKNAIFNSPNTSLLRGSSVYIYGGGPCIDCAHALISVGVSEINCYSSDSKYIYESWNQDTYEILKSVNISTYLYTFDWDRHGYELFDVISKKYIV